MAHRAGTRLLHRLRRSLGGGDAREPGRVNYISLGSHCHMAQALKQAGLRTWSGPFDWIFSSPSMVRHCLADDFATLLDPAQLETTPLSERRNPEECRGRHTYYSAHHGVPFVFNHHDPASSPEDYRFLGDGVRRLRAALANPEGRNHFYLLDAVGTPEAILADICVILAQYGEGNHLTVLRLEGGASEPAIVDLGAPRPDLRCVRLSARSTSVGLRFSDSSDDKLLLGFLQEEARRVGR
jgi:hypothetical protein